MKNITFIDELFSRRMLDTLGFIKYKLFPNSPAIRSIYKSNTKDNSLGYVELEYKGVKLKLKTIGKFTAAREVFEEEPYNWLNVKNSWVLDIGAGMGDTAIYFIINGAKEVEAYEPAEWAKTAQENINKNGFKAKVIKEAATSKTIDDFAIRNKGKRLILKIDCEGGEYEQILNSKKLKDYAQIQIEYHKGYINIESKLKENFFEVSHTRPIWFEKGYRVGYIYAKNSNIK